MDEPKLTIQSFHQCSSLISIKLTSTNYLMWRTQILHLARSLGVVHHLQDGKTPAAEMEDDKGNKSPNPVHATWINNDGLIISWIFGTIKEEMQSSVLEAESTTAYQIWTSLEEQLLPITVEKEGLLKNMIVTSKKGSRTLDEYLKEFKSICDNLAAIKKPISDLDKVFQFARGLG